MEDQSKQSCRVKPITAYFKDAIKFYDLDNSLVAQIIFLIQLAVVFGGYVYLRPYIREFSIVYEQFNVKAMEMYESGTLDMSFLNMELYQKLMASLASVAVILFFIKALSYFIGLFYGSYYYFGLTSPSMKGWQRASVYFRRLPKIILFNLLFFVGFYVIVLAAVFISVFLAFLLPIFSFLLMILPIGVMLIYNLFIFKDLLIIEFNTGVLYNFKKAWDITKGCRKNVIVNAMLPLIMVWLLSVLAVDIENQLLYLFITAFFEIIITLISQRLTALMFIDAACLERQDKGAEKRPETT